MRAEATKEAGRLPALVVDDDRDTRELLCQLLAREGLQPLRAYNGREAMVFLRVQTPRLVVLDLAMPEMNGWDLLAAIRVNGDLAQVPVIVVAGRSLRAAGLHRADVAAYFEKPLDIPAFRRTIQALIHRVGEGTHAP
jgi:DNA-binding response OmpR family regulator